MSTTPFTIISGAHGTGKYALANNIAFSYPHKIRRTESSKKLEEVKGDIDFPEDYILIIDECHNPIQVINKLQHADSFHKILILTQINSLTLIRTMEANLGTERSFNLIETHVLYGRAIP